MDVLCLGELMIDMIGQQTGSLADVDSFRRYPGGAAANVAVGAAKLGLSAGFLGRLSCDAFGDFLAQTMQHWGVDTTAMVRDEGHKTTVAFIAMDANKVPSYLFYRDGSASQFFCPADLNEAVFGTSRFLYFSSISLATSPIREANYEAVRLAHGHGCLVVFDPNVRLSVWGSVNAARDGIHPMLSNVDVLKLNDHELEMLFSEGPIERVCRGVFRQYPNLKLLAVTLGERGCFLMDPSESHVHVKAVSLPVVDTGGAGDSFTSAMLYFWIQNHGVSGLASMGRLGTYANSAAHITARRLGAIPALPNQQEIEQFIRVYRTESSA